MPIPIPNPNPNPNPDLNPNPDPNPNQVRLAVTRSLLEGVAREAQRKREQLSPREVSTLCWAFGRLRVPAPDLLANAEEVRLAGVALALHVEPAVPSRVPVAVEAHERALELLHHRVLLRRELREGDEPARAAWIECFIQK